MSVEKWWNEICGRGKWEKPREKPTQTPFRPSRNPHGGTETRSRDPSGGRRASNRLRHEAACRTYITSNSFRHFFLAYFAFITTIFAIFMITIFITAPAGRHSFLNYNGYFVQLPIFPRTLI